MNDAEADARVRIIRTAQEMNRSGINQGKSGNLSSRWADGFLVTPTGLPYDALAPDDITFVDSAGRHRGARLPSSEWRFHHDIYRTRSDANAIVHAHAPYCTTLACLRRDIPPFHYMVAVAGGRDIRCAPYATFGTQALSDPALQALQDRQACLLAHHGMIALGADPGRALALAIEVEALARLYWQALQVQEPARLDDAEMARVLEKFRSYGQQQ
jgi:L-fuculose-phosphate aldolase